MLPLPRGSRLLLQVLLFVLLHATKPPDVSKAETVRGGETAIDNYLPPNSRVDCMPAPHPVPSQKLCEQRGCMFDTLAKDTDPKCYFPKKSGYIVKRNVANPTNTIELEQLNGTKNPFGDNISPISFSTSNIDNAVTRIRIGSKGRFEAPLSLPMASVKPSWNKTDSFIVEASDATSEVFSFKVRRRSTGRIIWDTSIGGLMFADQYIQIAAFIGSSDIYGIGENVQYKLKHNMSVYSTWSLFARDDTSDSTREAISRKNLYGAYPFYLAMEKDHKAHGVLILNTNAQEFTLGPAPHIVYRTTGGMLDIIFFSGPTPEEVVQQYSAFVGRPALQSYWSLGYQLSRGGFRDLKELEELVKSNQRAEIPLDVVHADIEYMYRYEDFTVGKGWENVAAYVATLHNHSMHAILVIDPAVQANGDPFRRALERAANFVEWDHFDQVPKDVQKLYLLAINTKIMLGVGRPDKHVAFPDFSSNRTAVWWINEFARLHDETLFDGIWLEMNEPSSFGTNEVHPWYFDDPDHPNIKPLMCPLQGVDSKWEVPPYATYSVYQYNNGQNTSYLSSKSLCMSGVTKSGRIYDMKNVYGLQQSIVTQAAVQAATKERSTVITRSSYPSGGHYAGHWLGGSSATWNDMRASVIGIQLFNMFGVPYVGADIGGTLGDSNEELRIRWQQLGAFYSLSRSRTRKHATVQEPSEWESVTEATRQANRFRYEHLPYLYTLHFQSSHNGGTVVRPLFFEFPDDAQTLDIDHEFMWGSALLIVPIMEEYATDVTAYLPPQSFWYQMTGWRRSNKIESGYQVLFAGTDQLTPVLIRGGSAVPCQAPALTTADSRKNPLQLLFALDENGRAYGELIWDDGNSVVTDFKRHSFTELQFRISVKPSLTSLSITSMSRAYMLDLPKIRTIEIFGYEAFPVMSSIRNQAKKIYVDYAQSSFNTKTKRLIIVADKNDDFFDLAADWTVHIEWKNHQLSELMPSNSRVECMPMTIPPPRLEACENKDCIFDAEARRNVPKCYYPRTSGYILGNSTGSETELKKYGSSQTPYGESLASVSISTSFIQESTLNVRIGAQGRFEPALNLPRGSAPTGERFMVQYRNDTAVFSFKVLRQSTGAVIWDTSIGGMMFADQFVQIAAFIGSSEVYGIGENPQNQLKHDISDYTTWAMMARNGKPDPKSTYGPIRKNLYGVYPFYIALEEDAKAHGVLFVNSNPQEITIGPAPHVVYRTTGGMLDVYFFPGPSPEDVVRQYLALVGTPAPPPYWALGYQIGGSGYQNLDELEAAVNETQMAGIPFDVVYMDMSYADKYQDFTIGAGWERLPEYVDKMHHSPNNSMHAILVLDPAVTADSESFKRALASKATFVEWETLAQAPEEIHSLYPYIHSSKVMLGVSWPEKHVAYPDFSSPSTISWWNDELSRFHRKISFDGLVMDMNEPASFGTNEEHPWYFDDPMTHKNIKPLMCPLQGADSRYDVPPYETYNVYYYRKDNETSYLSSETLCMLGVTKAGRMYDTKNLYGLQQSSATHSALQIITSKRGTVITRSSFISGGRYSGHWLGYASNYGMQPSIVGMQLFNMFGIPYVGGEICGSESDIPMELCLRWHQLGALYPLSRQHKKNNAQWPAVTSATKQAVLFRYRYLPYLYTLHMEAALRGGTVVRPLFFEFPSDLGARRTSEEFMWGSSVLAIPVLMENVGSISAYFPAGSFWFSMLESNIALRYSGGSWYIHADIHEMIPVFIRGGSIIPRQNPATTAVASRQSPLEILIAVDPKSHNASGTLIWDDGESVIINPATYEYIDLRFTFTRSNKSTLKIERAVTNFSNRVPNISTVEIFGFDAMPVFCTIRKQPSGMIVETSNTTFDKKKKRLIIKADAIYNFAVDSVVTITWDSHEFSELVPYNSRVDCMPAMKPSPTEILCNNHGCIFDATTPQGVPKCYFPQKSGYEVLPGSSHGPAITLNSYDSVTNPYGSNISPIYFYNTTTTGNTLNIEIDPYIYRNQTRNCNRIKSLSNLEGKSIVTGESFIVEQSSRTGVFSFTVRRASTKALIWDTSIGGMMFADQFVQIAAKIGSSEVYGFGENVQQQLKHDMRTYTTWPMFSRDQPPDADPARGGPVAQNLYGVYPFYLAFERDNKAHGVLIFNGNAQEMVLGPAPHIVYRTIGGSLDLYFFPGPTPEDVIKQYAGLFGRPALPAYWALGYQISRYGYKDLNDLSNTVKSVQKAGIPLDVAHADIDYMNRYQDFTIGSGWEQFPAYVDKLHSESMHAILIFDPAIQVDGEVFERALKSKARFVEWERSDQVQHTVQDLYPLTKRTKVMLGVVWPDKHVAFPDFFANETAQWWIDEIRNFHSQIAFDGILIDMNEPANFGTNEAHPWYFDTDHPKLESLKCPLTGNDSKQDMPPYETYNVYVYNTQNHTSYLSSKTLCMSAVTSLGKLYDVKSIYGVMESGATQRALHDATTKRGVVITRSSFPSGGRFAGHWLGDSASSWDDLRTSVAGIQLFNLFGVPYIGADICGFRGDTTEELCLRWQQLGAFYTFSRNHNDKRASDQHPTVWPSVAKATRQANLFRYRYLPYLYSLHFEASMFGGTVIRPTFFEFPDVVYTHNNNEQFMWGSALLIVPVLRQNQTSVEAYLPETATWYSLREESYGEVTKSGFTVLGAPIDQLIPVFIRGGRMVPRQAPAMTTAASRKNPFEILIALDANGDCMNGTFFWDDGENLLLDFFEWRIAFQVDSQRSLLTITPINSATFHDIPTMDIIDIFGYKEIPDFGSTQLNGIQTPLENCAMYDSEKKMISINCTHLIDIGNGRPFTMQWSYGSKPLTTRSTTLKSTVDTTTISMTTVTPTETTTVTIPITPPVTTTSPITSPVTTTSPITSPVTTTSPITSPVTTTMSTTMTASSSVTLSTSSGTSSMQPPTTTTSTASVHCFSMFALITSAFIVTHVGVMR